MSPPLLTCCNLFATPPPGGMTAEDAWNECAVDLVEASRHHCHLCILRFVVARALASPCMRTPSSISIHVHSLLVMTRQSGWHVCTPLACTHSLPWPRACSCLSVTSHQRWRRWRIRLYGLRCVTCVCFMPRHTSLTTWVAGWATSLLTRYLTAPPPSHPSPAHASVTIFLRWWRACYTLCCSVSLLMLLFRHWSLAPCFWVLMSFL